MGRSFVVKPLMGTDQAEQFALRYGFKVQPQTLVVSVSDAFSDYIVLALSEQLESRQQRDEHYRQAIEYLQKAQALLRGQPHPAGGMVNKLEKMQLTLDKVIDNRSEVAEERAKRFVELNLVRRLRDVWQRYTNTPFYVGLDGSGRSPHDYLRQCFELALAQYPEIEWLGAVNDRAIDFMLKAIRS
ncbi:hypothetical protein GCM10025791_10070 [Halioxenophilus aromaticivorans]|uniref:Uncharacterized protein n=2 Tax=Halioxenophilus aromaticivorans TaxID=1306992 RepID=A0AAV3TYU6_9ALTE